MQFENSKTLGCPVANAEEIIAGRSPPGNQR